MPLIFFDDLIPNQTARKLLRTIGRIDSYTVITGKPLALRRRYSLELPTNFRTFPLKTPEYTGTDYYYNGVKILHVGVDPWISTHNLRVALDNEKVFTEEDAQSEHPEIERKDFEKRLKHGLYQLAATLFEDITENGAVRHINPLAAADRLQDLAVLKTEKPNLHKAIVASHQFYRELERFFPDWTDSKGTLQELISKEYPTPTCALLNPGFHLRENGVEILKQPIIKEPTDPRIVDEDIVRLEPDEYKLVQNKIILIEKLEKYVERIQQHINPDHTFDFKYGFWFFKNSRAMNREANYRLAEKFLFDLKYYRKKSIHEIFENDIGLRKEILKERKIQDRPEFTDRGINSTELKAIIAEAKNMDPGPKPSSADKNHEAQGSNSRTNKR